MANSKELTPAKRRNLAELTRGFRGIVLFLFLISGMINVLALTGSFYMMQIYDRALTSGSIPTLLVLSALAIGLYLFQGCFDVIRSQVLVRVGARLDQKIAPLAHRVAIDMPRFGFSTSEALERGRDVDTVRGFLGSQGPAALFDLPWMPIYLVFIYFLHPCSGALTFAGAFVLTVLTVVSEIMTKRLSRSTRKAAMARNTIADCNARNAEVLKAMGFAGRAVERFNDANARASGAADQGQRHHRHLCRDLARAAHDAAVGGARARCLSHDQGRALRRRHHRMLGGIRAGAGAGRPGDRQLEALRRGADGLPAACATRSWRWPPLTSR